MNENEEPFDFTALAETMDTYREALRAMVAGLKADGFTDEQARRLVTHMMTMNVEEP